MWEERLHEFVILFVVVNPIGALPAFLAVTAGLPAATQRRIALVMVIVSFVVLVFFMVAGGFVLEKMRISLRAPFRSPAASSCSWWRWRWCAARASAAIPAAAAASQRRSRSIRSPSPKVAGPEAMLAAVLVTDDHRFDPAQLSMTIGVLAVVMAITLVILLAAAPISRVIGESGARVIGRVLGMILAALAVNTILNAFGSWLGLPTL
jgi:multiple antibiotic resistance protein